MASYFTRISSLTLLIVLFTAKGAIALSIPTLRETSQFDVEASSSSDRVAEEAVAKIQNETIASDLPQRFKDIH